MGTELNSRLKLLTCLCIALFSPLLLLLSPSFFRRRGAFAGRVRCRSRGGYPNVCSARPRALRALRFARPAPSLPRAPAVIAGFAAGRPPPAQLAPAGPVARVSPTRAPAGRRRLLAAHRAGFAVLLLAPAASSLHRALRPTRQRKRACRCAAGPGNRRAMSRAPLFSLIAASLLPRLAATVAGAPGAPALSAGPLAACGPGPGAGAGESKGREGVSRVGKGR